MTLNVLIDKYLDGTLTREEDRELRRLVASSPEAALEFDSAVELAAALREDAETVEIPEDFADETEDLLMALIAEESSLATQVYGLLWNSPAIRMAVYTLCCIILVPAFFTSVSDGDILQITSIPQSLSHTNIDSFEAHHRIESPIVEKAQDSFISSQGDIIVNQSETLQEPVFVQSSEITSNVSEHQTQSQNNATNLHADDVDFVESHVSLALLDSSESFNSIASSAFSSIEKSSPFMVREFDRFGSLSLDRNLIFGNDFGFGFTNDGSYNEVQLSTFVGHDLLGNAYLGEKTPAVTMVSQSLAYSVGEYQSLGVELGTMTYTRRRSSLEFIPSPEEGGSFTPKNGGAIIQGKQLGGFNDGGSNGEFIDVLNIDQRSTVWGAIFYERLLTQHHNIGITARVGLGGSNDGFLSYLRATGVYQVMDNLSLSVGFNTRLLFMNNLDVQSRQENISTGFSLVYGIRFHL